MTSDTQLETLESKGLIRLATVQPELEYLFRHALVQDAAYGSLLKQERRELHGQVAEALEQLYPDRRSELAPVLAMHFEHAGDAEKAIDYYGEAARHALGQYAIQEAYAAFASAAALIDEAAARPDADAGLTDAEVTDRRTRRLEIALGQATAGYSFRPAEESFEMLERIVVQAEELGDPDLIGRVHTLIALGRLQSGEAASSPLVKRSLDRIAEIGEALGDPSLAAMPRALVGLSPVFAGPVRSGVEALAETLPLLASRQESIGAAFARGGLAIGYAFLGEFDKADAAAAQATEVARKGDLIAQLDAQIAEAMVRLLRGDLVGAAPIAADCIERAEQTGASACVVISSWILGDAFHRQGRFAEARDVLQRGSDVSLVVDRKFWRPTLQAWLGSAMVAVGDESIEDWDDALATARSIGNLVGEAGIHGKRAETLVAEGNLDAAIPDFEAAAAILEQQGMRPALARLLRSWGDALRARNRQADAEPILRRSLALFEELGLTAEAAAVRATLAIGGTKIAFD